MSRRKEWSLLVMALMGAMTPGCMPKMTLEQMKEHMPKRPAELDRLNDFVGKWSFEGEVKFAFLDEPVKVTGHGQHEWQGNRWYVVGNGIMKMADFDECSMVETWNYDTKEKKYRSTFVDSMGGSGTGTATYDEKAQTWHWSATGHGPWGESKTRGTMHIKDKDTMDWSMTETQGLMKIMDMKGTSKREP